MDTIWKLLLGSLIGTLFIFSQILSCVLFDMNFAPLYILLPAALTPVPMLLMKLCGGGDGMFDSPPRGLHWAEFFSAFFATGMIAIPILLRASDTIDLGAMLLSLGGFLFLIVCGVVWSFVKSRSDDSGGLSGGMYM